MLEPTRYDRFQIVPRQQKWLKAQICNQLSFSARLSAGCNISYRCSSPHQGKANHILPFQTILSPKSAVPFHDIYHRSPAHLLCWKGQAEDFKDPAHMTLVDKYCNDQETRDPCIKRASIQGTELHKSHKDPTEPKRSSPFSFWTRKETNGNWASP